jgi:hypothetical protein
LPRRRNRPVYNAAWISVPLLLIATAFTDDMRLETAKCSAAVPACAPAIDNLADTCLGVDLFAGLAILGVLIAAHINKKVRMMWALAILGLADVTPVLAIIVLLKQIADVPTS